MSCLLVLRHATIMSFAIIAGIGICCSPVRAQSGSGKVPSIAGRITGIETKGRTTTVTFTDEAGTEYEFPLTPKTEVEIVSTGDDGFLAPGKLVKIDAIQSNNAFFGSTFAVYPDYAGRIQPARAVKAPAVPGQSQNLHIVTGEIVRLDDKGDGKYHLLQLKVNPKSELTVYVEPSHRVNVISTDGSALQEGQSATVIGRATGSRLQVAKITVNTGETLKSDDAPPAEKKE